MEDRQEERLLSFASDQHESPQHQIISFLTAPASPPTNDGVPLPPLLQDFFGIDFLPRHIDENTSARALIEDAESTPSELSLEEEENEEANASLEVKKKRLTVGGLASRVRQTKERRKQRKRLGSVESDSSPTSSEKKEHPRKSHVNEAWIQKQQAKLQQHKASLDAVQQETLQVEARARNLSEHVSQIQEEVAELERHLSNSMQSLQQDTRLLQQSKNELKRLEAKRNKAARAVQETSVAIRAALGKPPRRPRSSLDDDPVLNPKMANVDSTHSAPVRRRAESAPVALRTSSSFIRVHDLELENSSLSETSSSQRGDAKDMFFLDNDVNTVLQALAKFGYDLATDESKRFVPALNTEKLLSQYTIKVDPSWPLQPWQAAHGKDVLVWTGCVDHNGHGCDLPVIKSRAIIPTTPRQVLELVMDSSRATEYNKMSQGRKDVIVLQKGIDTSAEESDYGIAGEAKIIKSLNKPPLIRRSIEMLSLIYARPLENADGYLAVNRSVWEDSSATPKTSKDTVRSEILLGVNIFRPVQGPNKEQYCELTTITHAHTSVVPDALARKMGPTQAATFMRDLQMIFSKS